MTWNIHRILLNARIQESQPSAAQDVPYQLCHPFSAAGGNRGCKLQWATEFLNIIPIQLVSPCFTMFRPYMLTHIDLWLGGFFFQRTSPPSHHSIRTIRPGHPPDHSDIPLCYVFTISNMLYVKVMLLLDICLTSSTSWVIWRRKIDPAETCVSLREATFTGT